MADGINAGPDYLQKSLLMHQAMEDTPFQMPQPGAMGNPQQLMQMLQNPQMQQQLANFGIHFDPNLVQRSPFFNNQFMGQHPQMGGALTGAMANLASTPAAPLVSGAGSGISRFAQGAQMGPEDVRQYQLRQLMAPFQQLGATMPMMGEQRRQQLTGGMIKNMDERQQLMQEDEYRRQQQDMMSNQLKGQQEQDRVRSETDRINATRPNYFAGPGGQVMESYYQAPGSGPLGGILNPGGWQERNVGVQSGSQLLGRQGQGPSDPRLNPNYQPGKDKREAAKNPKAKGGATGKQLSDIEKKKADAYARLQKDYSPYFGGDKTPPPQGYNKQQWADEEKRKTEEFKGQQQQIENAYGNERGAIGAPVPGYQYPGQRYQGPGTDYYNNQSIMNPGGQQQGQGAPGGGRPTHTDEAGNLWDMSNPQQPRYLGNQGGGQQPGTPNQ